MTCSVLLDLDGTLIDSYPGILASSLAALRAQRAAAHQRGGAGEIEREAQNAHAGERRGEGGVGVGG